jgi:hypothetical protein
MLRRLHSLATIYQVFGKHLLGPASSLFFFALNARRLARHKSAV